VRLVHRRNRTEMLDLLGALEDAEGVLKPFVDSRSLQWSRSRPPGPGRSGGFRPELVPE